MVVEEDIFPLCDVEVPTGESRVRFESDDDEDDDDNEEEQEDDDDDEDDPTELIDPVPVPPPPLRSRRTSAAEPISKLLDGWSIGEATRARKNADQPIKG